MAKNEHLAIPDLRCYTVARNYIEALVIRAPCIICCQGKELADFLGIHYTHGQKVVAVPGKTFFYRLVYPTRLCNKQKL
jgi:hypothetical protein